MSPRTGPHEKRRVTVRELLLRRSTGYIVNLTVILDGIFKTTAGNVTENTAPKVTDSHIRSGRRDQGRDSIHRDIRSFVTKTFAVEFAIPQRYLVLEMIIDLIRQYSPPSN